ncbi:hypothetical protein [Streptomyces catenulae]|uniref:Uncharacterized protein n=1 Tax=Streptomyces catenulae TaxID=66875 RepID=A0ABV2YSP9_9ACTN|nr:hypothetical protein [Streptomyces catenulae]
MPELPEPTPAGSGDYLGRLLARYAPAPPADPFGPPGGADGPGRRALVRPRLPGPFERVEAVRGPADGEAADDGLSSPRAAGRPVPAPSAGQPPRTAHRSEIHTRAERETVIRTEAAPEADRGPVAPGPVPAPALRPTATATPAARATATEGVRPRGRAAADPARPAAGREAAPWDGSGPAPSGALRPRADAPVAPRRTAPPRTAAAGGRRGARGPAERVVHVEIGRLEVSAAGAERPAAGGRPARPERRAPAVSLADYLADQERTSGGRSH